MRRKRGMKYCCILIFVIFISGISPVLAAEAAGGPNPAEKLTFFASDPFQYGLWVYNPVTNQREVINEEITEHYQISPSGRYLAFLVNNQDRGGQLENTVSLWVLDWKTGKETAVVSDFDTDHNLAGQFSWLETDELLLEQVNPTGGNQVKVVRPDGEVVWQSTGEYQYLCRNDLWLVLRNSLEETLCACNLFSRQWQSIPVRDAVLQASLSPGGTYLVYQTWKETVLLNLSTNEKRFIDTGEPLSIEFGWSPQDEYLVCQRRKISGEAEYCLLTVLRPDTGTKVMEVSSTESILYSWSWDAKQLAYCLYQNAWNIMVWMPEAANTVLIRTGLSAQTRPLYRNQTHEFVYIDRIDASPAIYSYDVDLNHLRLLQAGIAGGSWENLHWTPLEVRSKAGTPVLQFAGTDVVKSVTYLCPFILEKNPNSDVEMAKAAAQRIKWAPNHQTLLYQSNDHRMMLFDRQEEQTTVTFDSGVGEMFWSPDGAMVGGVSGANRRELAVYTVFRPDVTRYSLPAGKWNMAQWMNQRILLLEERLIRYFPLSGDWERDNGWKENWWPLPRVERAHNAADSLWQIQANIWIPERDGSFRVFTRLSESPMTEWREEGNEYPSWSPDDERILYHKRFGLRKGGRDEARWQVWMTDRTGAIQQYLCDGAYPQWLGNYQFLFIRGGDLWLANLVTGQMVQLVTPKLQEIAFRVSYDNAVLAVVARGEDEKTGLYLYSIK